MFGISQHLVEGSFGMEVRKREDGSQPRARTEGGDCEWGKVTKLDESRQRTKRGKEEQREGGHVDARRKQREQVSNESWGISNWLFSEWNRDYFTQKVIQISESCYVVRQALGLSQRQFERVWTDSRLDHCERNKSQVNINKISEGMEMLATRRPGRDGLQEVHRSVGTSILQQGLVRLIFLPTVAKCDDASWRPKIRNCRRIGHSYRFYFNISLLWSIFIYSWITVYFLYLSIISRMNKARHSTGSSQIPMFALAYKINISWNNKYFTNEMK